MSDALQEASSNEETKIRSDFEDEKEAKEDGIDNEDTSQISDHLFICESGSRNIADHCPTLEKRIFKSPPTTHQFNKCFTKVNGTLLAVGFTNGEINVFNPNNLTGSMKSFNVDKCIDKTSVTCIRWVPDSECEFIVSHSSGSMYLYKDCQAINSTSSKPMFQLASNGLDYSIYTSKNASKNPAKKWTFERNSHLKSTLPKQNTWPTPRAGNKHSVNHEKEDMESVNFSNTPNYKNDHNGLNNLNFINMLEGEISNASCINQFEFSPCGTMFAVVTQDGYLRVFDYENDTRLGFMRSYFGGLLCLAWSPDGEFIAVGGQDDMITLWSLKETAVICRGQGHKSWITAVAFDPFMCYNEVSQTDAPISMAESISSPHEFKSKVYRIGSVGQDTLLGLWEVTSDVIRQGLRFVHSARHRAADSTATALSRQFHMDEAEEEDHERETSPQPPPPQPVIGDADASSAAGGFSPQPQKLNDCRPPSPHEPMETAGVVNQQTMWKENEQESPLKTNNRRQHRFFSLKKLTSNKTKEPRTSEGASVVVKKSILCNQNGRGNNNNHRFPLSWIGRLHVRDRLKLTGDESLSNSNFSNKLNNTLAPSLKSIPLGSVACPRLDEVPILEPLVITRASQDRITDMLFKSDGIDIACQQGYILTWKRPISQDLSQMGSEDASLIQSEERSGPNTSLPFAYQDESLERGGIGTEPSSMNRSPPYTPPPPLSVGPQVDEEYSSSTSAYAQRVHFCE